jgi:hypothetical protein
MNVSVTDQIPGDALDTIRSTVEADVLIPGLEEHVRTLTLAIDSIVAGDVAAAS